MNAIATPFSRWIVLRISAGRNARGAFDCRTSSTSRAFVPRCGLAAVAAPPPRRGSRYCRAAAANPVRACAAPRGAGPARRIAAPYRASGSRRIGAPTASPLRTRRRMLRDGSPRSVPATGLQLFSPFFFAPPVQAPASLVFRGLSRIVQLTDARSALFYHLIGSSVLKRYNPQWRSALRTRPAAGGPANRAAALAQVARAGRTHLRAAGHAQRRVGGLAQVQLQQLGRAVHLHRGGAGPDRRGRRAAVLDAERSSSRSTSADP